MCGIGCNAVTYHGGKITGAEEFKVGDRVLVARDVTYKDVWIEATVDEEEDNPYVGKVITVLTDDGVYYSSYARNFKEVSREHLA